MPLGRASRPRKVCSKRCRLVNLLESRRVVPGRRLTGIEKQARHAARNPGALTVYKRRARLKSKGLTLESFSAMLAGQGGACALCLRGHVPGDARLSLVVDHCHVTGAIRGLLCHWCNRGIGLLRDDPGLLIRAAEYLRKYV